MKCDRGRPCEQCIKKDKASECTYAVVPARKKAPKSMQNRLNRLENLVKDMMTVQSPDAISSTSSGMHLDPTDDGNTESFQTMDYTIASNVSNLSISTHSKPDQNTSPKASPLGQVLVGRNQTTYVGASHWAALLNDVRCESKEKQLYDSLLISPTADLTDQKLFR